MAEKGMSAKKFFSRLLAAVIAAASGGAVWAGCHYGLFSDLMPDRSSVPDGFIDEDATHAFVEFIDVGQGDAALIGSEGHFMLIDTGTSGKTDKITGLLLKEGVSVIDYLIISDLEEEHLGGAAEIISNFEIRRIIIPKIPVSVKPDPYFYSSFEEAAEARGYALNAAGNESCALGGCTFDTIVPKKDHGELKDHSVWIRLTHGDNRFLFTGDGGQPEEEELLSRGIDLSADVLKAGDHGGKDSCTSALLSAVLPKHTVISCGKNNVRGDPNRDTLRRISKFSPNVYLTAENGSVRFDSDGSRLNVTAEKDDPS